MNLKRTHRCHELNESLVGQTVIVNGWINTRRDLGGIYFLDVRDRYGLIQVRVGTELPETLRERVRKMTPEDVIAVKGQLALRPEDAINPKMASGTLELLAEEVELLNKAKTPPFEITRRETGSEDLRLKYRYLDLRTQTMQKNILLRHETGKAVRQFLNDEDFLEIETPVLMKSTPEGARDFLVPSRLHLGHFYALPQSPQTYKQLLMVSGFDKYYQIVKCFRDEDLRADRQPEFTQIDIEMSFVDEPDVRDVGERLLAAVMKAVKNIDLPLPLPVYSYQDAMETYGTDKPDTRFDLPLFALDEIAEKSDFQIFRSVLASGGVVRGLRVPGGSDLSRKQIDGYTDLAKKYGLKGLAFVKVEEGGLSGGISKFFNDSLSKELIAVSGANPGDLLFFSADTWTTALTALGAVRLQLGKDLNLIEKDVYKALWVNDFPLVERSEGENRFVAMHHPFTSPRPEDEKRMETDPESVRAQAYDLVLNGHEIAGGSIRIYREVLQEKMFRILGISHEEARQKFGFLLDAFQYGAPPHGGIAFGFDRLVMILAGADSIREVIAFPKTTTAQSPMDNAPDVVDEKQLKELHLRVESNEY
ncbi:MAG: Aspartate--tRNA ligase [Marinimicrobia bacterium 46_47]|nr:MAG: Aspartate--tRNA ligase [Marinimicrobia bacterium 46_47]KUK91750.1 MAG: aspartyl-tRNA synthetase [Marinimicrobia bacterium 46_43]HBY18362.1 aspartate--tRNA ligase [Candidatus Neomarinimicrobiota bacterium]